MATLDDTLDSFYAGDAARLERSLRTDSTLVNARVASSTGHYSGYFHRATLLHHVAGNPLIRPLPASTVELTRLLLDLGAEVDAATEQGPSQPDDIGWSTLGLAATSDEARKAGVQLSLLGLLRARGADLDFRNGGPLVGAIYYGELDAARWLVEQGAKCDFIAAAGLGDLPRMASFLAAAGTLLPDAHSLVHYSQVRERPPSPDAVLGLALVVASMRGHLAAADWLLARGADVNARPPFDHYATPLHWAALNGHTDVAKLLVSRGADRNAHDRSFDATAEGWADHNGHAALAELLRE